MWNFKYLRFYLEELSSVKINVLLESVRQDPWHCTGCGKLCALGGCAKSVGWAESPQHVPAGLALVHWLRQTGQKAAAE